MKGATAAFVAGLFAVASCSFVQPLPPGPGSASSSPEPSATAKPTAPSSAPIRSSTAFHFDVVNQSGGNVVVSVTSDIEAELPGFAPGQSGTIVIQLADPLNGIGIEIQDGRCGLLATATYPTTAPFTLVIGNVSESGHLQLSIRPDTAPSPIPLPSNGIIGCGG